MHSSRTLVVPGYQVIKYLGSGARSSIWHIQDCRTGKDCALKRIARRTSDDERFIEQAMNEYEVGAQFHHPVLRSMIDLRRIRKWFTLHEVHLIMELCQGKTLQEAQPDNVPEIVRIFTEVATALGHMNAHGFVHADIKPNNIMVADDGTVKIIDFGQSCKAGTIKERIQGTPDFIAPEQVYRRPLDGRTDVFNLGAAMYWTLTGQPIPTILPPKGSVTRMLAELIIPPPEQFNPAVPAALSKLVMDCVESNPQRRPAAMGEIVSRMGLIAYKLRMDQSGRPPRSGAAEI